MQIIFNIQIRQKLMQCGMTKGATAEAFAAPQDNHLRWCPALLLYFHWLVKMRHSSLQFVAFCRAADSGVLVGVNSRVPD